tara:strand:- start:1348 stop:1926 length:579 start_codon:yes stop_codon:yes gene_type:complete
MESSAPIYRFKIIQTELQENLIDFASYHKYEDAATLKESYKQWLTQEDISGLVSRETQLMLQHGYDFQQQSLEDKLFKSIKYYHIKKMLNPISAASPADRPNKWKNQVQFSKEIMASMREHLTKQSDVYVKPSESFEEFKKQPSSQMEMEKEKTRLGMEEEDQANGFEAKLKKAFKNQYFALKSKKNNKGTV